MHDWKKTLKRNRVVESKVIIDYPDRYKELDKKEVYDTDGFITGYTLYYDALTDCYFTIFGDSDLYYPKPHWDKYDIGSEADAVFDTEEEAWEFYDCYESNGYDFYD